MNAIHRALVTLWGLSLLVVGCAQTSVESCDQGTCLSGMMCQAGACEEIPPDPTGNLGRHTSVAVRPDGRRVIATWDGSQDNLILFLENQQGHLDSQVVAGWSSTRGVVKDTNAGQWSSVALDHDEAIHLTWYDATEGALMYQAVMPGQTAAPEVVDDTGNRGTHTHLVVEQTGVVHVSYRDEGGRSLRYARRDVDGSWSHEAVPSCGGPVACDVPSEDYGEYGQVVVVGGAPRLVFYDRDHGDLKLAAPRDTGAGEWDITILDGVDPETGEDRGDVGRFVSVALDAKSRLAVAYYDHTAGALRFLSAEAAGSPIVVDDGLYWDEVSGARRNHPVGQHVHLDVDLHGRAHLIYLDSGNLQMKRAQITGQTVTGPFALSDLEAGGHVGFGVDAEGRLVGAYGAWTQQGDDVMSTRLERFTIDVGTP